MDNVLRDINQAIAWLPKKTKVYRVSKDAVSYTHLDGEPIYNLGLALKYQGRYNEAYDRFYKACWNAAWQDAGSVSYTHLFLILFVLHFSYFPCSSSSESSFTQLVSRL